MNLTGLSLDRCVEPYQKLSLLSFQVAGRVSSPLMFVVVILCWQQNVSNYSMVKLLSFSPSELELKCAEFLEVVENSCNIQGSRPKFQLPPPSRKNSGIGRPSHIRGTGPDYSDMQIY